MGRLNCLVRVVSMWGLLILLPLMSACAPKEDHNSSHHSTSSLVLKSTVTATESSASISSQLFYSYLRVYGVRLTGGDAIYANDGVNEIQLYRHAKAYPVRGEIDSLASRTIQLRFERGPENPDEDAPDTMLLLPLPALIYPEDTYSNDQEIVIDWRLDPDLSEYTRLNGAVKLLSCSDSADQDALAEHFPKRFSIYKRDLDTTTPSTRHFLPPVAGQLESFDCQFSLLLSTVTTPIAIDPSYYPPYASDPYDTDPYNSDIVVKAFSDLTIISVKHSLTGEGQ